MSFNGDTNVNNYGATAVMYTAYAQWGSNVASIPIHGFTADGSGSRTVGYVLIDNVNKDIPKVISGGGSKASIINGVYLGNAITSITVAALSGNLTGDFYVYGIAG